MALYTGFQFQPGTAVFYTYELRSGLHGVTESMFGDTYQGLTTAALEEWDSHLNIDFQYTSDPIAADLYASWTIIDGSGGVLGFFAPYDTNGNGIISGPDEGIGVIAMDISDFGTRLFSATMKHEIGHALGLAHDETPGTLMNSLLDGSETITAYDVAKAAALYGYDTSGSSLADLFAGSGRADIYSGKAGDDTIAGNDGGDLLYGNQGLDSVSGGDGADTLYGGQNAGDLSGTPLALRDGVELLWGDAGDDLLYGNHGSDVLVGGFGNDTLYGGQDGDSLQGNHGDDVMHGNLGADVFYFNLNGEGNEGADSIVGFDASEDRIDLTDAVVTQVTAGDGGVTLLLSTGTTIVLVGVPEAPSTDLIVT